MISVFTKDELASLVDFIELEFFNDIKESDCDNIQYVYNICSVWKKAKEASEDGE